MGAPAAAPLFWRNSLTYCTGRRRYNSIVSVHVRMTVTNILTAEEPDEDNMEEIETGNILGSRTRGKNIDFAKANQELGDEDEEEDDEDFVDPDDQMKD